MKKLLVLLLTLSAFAFATEMKQEIKHDEAQAKRIAEMKAKMAEEQAKFMKQYYPETNSTK